MEDDRKKWAAEIWTLIPALRLVEVVGLWAVCVDLDRPHSQLIAREVLRASELGSHRAVLVRNCIA